MIKITSLKPGDVVYDCHRQKIGNTTASELGVWTVKILDVDIERSIVRFSWNGNSPDVYHGKKFSWRRWPPEWIPKVFGTTKCAICYRSMEEGHHPDCIHPKAMKR